jgi:hypothetical protein
MRLPFLIFFLAAIAQYLFDNFKQKEFRKLQFVSCCIGVFAVLGYFLYNKYLGDKYGTMFLTSLLPIKNWGDYRETVSVIWKNWNTEYFTIFHYALVLIGLFFVFISKQKKGTNFSISLGLSLLGGFVFFMLMGQQFTHHDYYFIDSFFPGIVIGFAFLLKEIKFKNRKGEIAAIFILGLISLGAIYRSKEVLKERYADVPWDMFGITLINFDGSKEFLDNLKIPRNAKMLVIDSYSTNMPLIQMHRKGYTVINTERKFIEKAMKNDFDFVVLQNQFAFQGSIANYPEMMEQLELIGTNGKILVYKKAKQKITQSLSTFLGLNNVEKISLKNLNGLVKDFKDLHWSNYFTLDSLDFVSPDFSILLEPSQEFGPTYTDTVKNLFLVGNETIRFSGKIKAMNGKDLPIVFSIDDAQHKNYHYIGINLKSIITPSPEWQKFECQFRIPKIKFRDDILKIYFWNPHKATIKIDSLSLQFSDSCWSNCNILDTVDLVSHKFSILLSPTQKFGPAYTDTVKNLFLKGKESIRLSGKAKTLEGNGLQIVFSIDDVKHQNYHYASFNLKDFMGPSLEWKNIEYLFPVPEIKSKNDILKIYFWNPDKSKIKIADLSLEFIRYR